MKESSHFMALGTIQDVVLRFEASKRREWTLVIYVCDDANWRAPVLRPLSHTSQRAQVLERALGMCCLWSSCLFSSGPDGWSACYLITAHDSGVYSKPLSGVRLKKIDWTMLLVRVLCEFYTFRSLVTFICLPWRFIWLRHIYEYLEVLIYDEKNFITGKIFVSRVCRFAQFLTS